VILGLPSEATLYEAVKIGKSRLPFAFCLLPFAFCLLPFALSS
jgi:hypothetical protein